MNRTEISKRMRELSINIADLQAEFRALTTEKVRLDLIKKAAPKRKRRKKRRKTTKKVIQR